LYCRQSAFVSRVRVCSVRDFERSRGVSVFTWVVSRQRVILLKDTISRIRVSSNERARKRDSKKEREGRFFVWPSGGGNRVSPRGGIDRRRESAENRDRVKGPAGGSIFVRRRVKEWNIGGNGNGSGSSNSGGGGDVATATAASTAKSSNSRRRRPGANNLPHGEHERASRVGRLLVKPRFHARR